MYLSNDGGDKLKLETLREMYGLSRQHVAEKIGVSRQCVWDWEKNGKIPSAEKALKLANLFNVTVEYLMEAEKHDQEKI